MNEVQAAILDQLLDSTVALAFLLGGIGLLAWKLKAQPTRRSFVLVFLPVPVLLLAFYWPWLEILAALYTPLLVLVLLLDGFWWTPRAECLSLHRTVGRKLPIGEESSVQLSITNNSGETLVGQIRDSLALGLMAGQAPASFDLPVTLAPFSHQVVSYPVFPTRRGQYAFGRVSLRYRSRLGLLWLIRRDGRPETVNVVPDMRRVHRLRIQASRALNAGELQKRSLGLEGTQFSGLRHYFAGDDVRKMAWQATAKLDVPVVRTFEHEVEQPILVLLDAGRRMREVTHRLSKYDWALNTALAFMAVALDRNDRVGAGVFSNQVLAHVPIGSGKVHLNRLLEALGRTEPQAVEPDYESILLHFARSLKRRALVVVFTDLADAEAARSLLRALKSFSGNHVVMVVTLSATELERQAACFPESPEEAYQKGVALDLLQVRRQALGVLAKTSHAVVVDAPPEQLDEMLLKKYLGLKAKNWV